MSEPFIGEIVMFAGNFALRGWAFFQGQILAISTNSALFSILGTTYGRNRTTTFGLPDLRSRAPVGQGHGPGLSNVALGELAGSERVNLTTAPLPSHAPTIAVEVAIPAVTASANVAAVPSNSALLGPVTGGGRPGTLYSTDVADVALKPFAVNVTVMPVGGNLPVPIRDPYLGINFIIALEGIYPSRN